MIAAALLGAALALQSPPSAAITPAQRRILEMVASRDLATRARGQRELVRDKRMLQNPAVGRALARVLAEDNRVIRADFSRGRETPEGLAELDAELSDVVRKAFGFRDPFILRTMIFGAYDPRSAFAFDVAAEGARVLPAVRRLLADPLEPWRAQGIGVLAFMLQRQAEGKIRHPLTATQQKWARGRLRAAARGGSITARFTAAWALGLVGTSADLAVLRHIASSDPTCHPHHSNDLCSQAQQAIAAIEKRAAHARPPTHKR